MNSESDLDISIVESGLNSLLRHHAEYPSIPYTATVEQLTFDSREDKGPFVEDNAVKITYDYTIRKDDTGLIEFSFRSREVVSHVVTLSKKDERASPTVTMGGPFSPIVGKFLADIDINSLCFVSNIINWISMEAISAAFILDAPKRKAQELERQAKVLEAKKSFEEIIGLKLPESVGGLNIRQGESSLREIHNALHLTQVSPFVVPYLIGKTPHEFRYRQREDVAWEICNLLEDDAPIKIVAHETRVNDHIQLRLCFNDVSVEELTPRLFSHFCSFLSSAWQAVKDSHVLTKRKLDLHLDMVNDKLKKTCL